VSALPGDATPRIVLDTNVCLDLFVFGDPAVSALRDALSRGEIIGMTDAGCRDEWRRVLAYPVLRLDEDARDAPLQAYDAVMRPHAADRRVERISTTLPRCADPDDQKFLELAAACDARWLLSRDDALLKLARRMRRDSGLEILSPRDWCDAWACPPC
jgi:predicted nucleic acid-binding protein